MRYCWPPCPSNRCDSIPSRARGRRSRKCCCTAAVLILVCTGSGEPHIVLTERTHQVEHHKGQVSFPGGACDDEDESVEATVHLADAYTLRGSYNQATEVINKALAADPKNERLIAMREQIASDNADSSIGIIGVRRGGAVLPSGRGR